MNLDWSVFRNPALTRLDTTSKTTSGALRMCWLNLWHPAYDFANKKNAGSTLIAYIYIYLCILVLYYIYICVYYIIYIYRLCEIYPGFLPQTWNPDLSPLQTQSLRWKGSENLSRNVPRKRTADIGTDRNSTRPVGKAQVVPSGNLTLCNGKSPLLVGKPSKAWAMFHI